MKGQFTKITRVLQHFLPKEYSVQATFNVPLFNWGRREEFRNKSWCSQIYFFTPAMDPPFQMK